MKQRTINVFYKWAETAKSSDKFIWEGVPYTKSEMEKHIHGESKPAPKPEPKVEETINIDIETEDEDMGQSLHGGDPEEY